MHSSLPALFNGWGLEADIFPGIPRVTGLGWERKKFNREWAGPGKVMIPNFTHKYTFYINKL